MELALEAASEASKQIFDIYLGEVVGRGGCQFMQAS